MSEESSKSPKARRTVALSERDVADALRLLFTLLADAPESPREKIPRSYLQLSRDIVARRKARSRYFSRAMFGEPGWDMLLVLFAMDAAGARQTVGTLTEKSGTPPSSALRWLHYLEKHALVLREPHPNDRRTVYIKLTDKGRKAIEDYLDFTCEHLDRAYGV